MLLKIILTLILIASTTIGGWIGWKEGEGDKILIMFGISLGTIFATVLCVVLVLIWSS